MLNNYFTLYCCIIIPKNVIFFHPLFSRSCFLSFLDGSREKQTLLHKIFDTHNTILISGRSLFDHLQKYHTWSFSSFSCLRCFTDFWSSRLTVALASCLSPCSSSSSLPASSSLSLSKRPSDISCSQDSYTQTCNRSFQFFGNQQNNSLINQAEHARLYYTSEGAWDAFGNFLSSARAILCSVFCFFSSSSAAMATSFCTPHTHTQRFFLFLLDASNTFDTANLSQQQLTS